MSKLKNIKIMFEYYALHMFMTNANKKKIYLFYHVIKCNIGLWEKYLCWAKFCLNYFIYIQTDMLQTCPSKLHTKLYIPYNICLYLPSLLISCVSSYRPQICSIKNKQRVWIFKTRTFPHRANLNTVKSGLHHSALVFQFLWHS